jgi:hypothetical protein
MKRLATLFALCGALMGCGSDSSPSTPTVQPANLVAIDSPIWRTCDGPRCTLIASIQNTGTGCASGTAVVARLYDSRNVQVGSDVPMMATTEWLASKTIRPNDIVALTSEGYVDSTIIVGTTWRFIPTWTNVKCS